MIDPLFPSPPSVFPPRRKFKFTNKPTHVDPEEDLKDPNSHLSKNDLMSQDAKVLFFIVVILAILTFSS